MLLLCMNVWPRFSTTRARSSVSTVSTSSFSSPSKSVRSSVRTLVALLRSASAELIFVVSSSVSDVSSAMRAVESWIAASRSPIVRFALVMASSFMFASSSHHVVYSSISFSSATRSAATLPLSSSSNVMTFWTGLTLVFKVAASTTAARIRVQTSIATRFCSPANARA